MVNSCIWKIVLAIFHQHCFLYANLQMYQKKDITAHMLWNKCFFNLWMLVVIVKQGDKRIWVNLHLTNYKAFIKLVFINYRSVLQTNVIMESYVNLEILNGTAYISISKQCIYVKARCYWQITYLRVYTHAFELMNAKVTFI